MTQEEFREKVRLHVAQLLEHCDAVQILVSYNEEALTHSFYSGAGNWYARQGMAHDFISVDQAQTLATGIKNLSEE